MTFGFDQLDRASREVARPRRRDDRRLGTVSNKEDGGPGDRPRRQRRRLLVHRRAAHGRDDRRRQAAHAVPALGDRVRLEMLDGQGRSIFGAIDQRIRRPA
jgi:hypothetical protein